MQKAWSKFGYAKQNVTFALLKNLINNKMLNNYETVFILTPVLSDEQAKETVKRYKDYLKENGATLVHEENWGLKKLAYPIKKKENSAAVDPLS